MSLAIGILLAALAAGFVALPFFRKDADEHIAPEPAEAQVRRHLEHDKAEAYGAIRDLELDHHIGKLSDADFRALRSKYETQALEAIAALEAAQPPASAPPRASSYKFCPQCGSALPSVARFCPGCGSANRGLPLDSLAA
jgi:hypothetical protein